MTVKRVIDKSSNLLKQFGGGGGGVPKYVVVFRL